MAATGRYSRRQPRPCGIQPDAMERFRVEGADSLLGGQQATCLLPPLGNRWLHVQGVVERARFVAPIFDEGDQALLITAAYLYDLGYAPSLKQTAFQPLDGAVYLRSQGYERVACLVTHHFAVRYEAQVRGCDALLQEFPRERSPLADALEYCNCTTGPTGEQITLKQCAAEIRSRYQAGDVVVQALGLAMPHLALAVARTQQRLLRSGDIHV